MVGVKPSVSLICTVLARSAILLAVAAVLLLSSGRGASAAGPYNLTGVFCLDVYLNSAPVQTKGQPPGAEDARATKILSRIEPSATQPGDWDITSVAYTGPGVLIPTKPPSAQSCAQKGDGNLLNDDVPFKSPTEMAENVAERPQATAKIVTKGSQKNLWWEICEFEPDLLTGTSVFSKFELVLTGKTLGTYYGILTAYLDNRGTEANPFCTTSPNITTYVTLMVSTRREVTKGPSQIGIPNDDWDADSCSDWDELALVPPGGRDPFNPWDCSVGGIAGLPEIAGAPLETGSSSGSRVGLIAGLAAGATAGIAALAGGVWYRRRRRPA